MMVCPHRTLYFLLHPAWIPLFVSCTGIYTQSTHTG